jgi:hypothetical protein
MEPAAASAPPSNCADPFPELEQLRRLNRQWQRGAVALGAGFVFLFILSLIQFLGTLTACKLLKEARRESGRTNRETADMLREMRSILEGPDREARAMKSNAVPDPTKVDAEPQAGPLELALAEQLANDVAALEKLQRTTDPETKAERDVRIAELSFRVHRLNELYNEQTREREKQAFVKSSFPEMLPSRPHNNSCPFPVPRTGTLR